MALYAFDGTWNVRDRKEAIDVVQSPQYGLDAAARRDTVETNVHRFKEFYGAERAEYLQGVGTRFSVIGRIVGGAFGVGGRHRIRRMYRRLTERYFAGDREIDIVGFSRGAALSVHFANVLARHGLRNPSNPRHLAWWYYRDLGWTFRHPKPGPDDVAAPTVHFLGLWDTVATFGVPVWPFRNRGKKWMVWSIPDTVKASFHAMALDEVRSTFALVRPRNTTYEVWFRGAHSNIGGGYLDRGLADIALAWMMEQAVWALGRQKRTPPERFEEALRLLGPEPGPPPDWTGLSLETLEPDPDGMVGRPTHLRDEAWRELPDDALIHHSVYLRQPNLVSDHRASNRPLLRRVPMAARAVYDPPLFYGGTRLEAARKSAEAAFVRVPVRPQTWLRVDEHFVIRSDNWIALATQLGRSDPNGPVKQTSREAFLSVAVQWMLRDRPADPSGIELPADMTDHKGRPIGNPDDVKGWIVRVLASLTPYLPA